MSRKRCQFKQRARGSIYFTPLTTRPVTTSYDNLDRPTQVNYLDGTYEQITYNALDASLMRDRAGHWTKQVHDPLRHVTDTYDSIGRHTKLDWCTCGALESITDPWATSPRGCATCKTASPPRFIPMPPPPITNTRPTAAGSWR